MTRFASAFFFKIIFLLSFVLSCYIVDASFKCDNAWERFAMRYDTGNESHYETVALQANSWILRNETNIKSCSAQGNLTSN